MGVKSFKGLRWPSGERTCLSPLRPKVQVSVRTISMRLEPSPHVKRVKVNALPKVVGFLAQGKLTGWVRQKGPQ
jgi:hypothetical protein